MNKIYFDYNIIVDLIEERNEELNKVVDSIDRSKKLIVYSPAHIEEIATAKMRHGFDWEGTKDKLNFLSKLTSNYELLPYEISDVRLLSKEGIFLCEELPLNCYNRVVSQYDKNDVAEVIEESILTDFKKNNYFKNNPQIMNEIPPENILRQFHYWELIAIDFSSALSESYGIKINASEAIYFKFKDVKNDFRKFETLVNVIANFLEMLRYWPDKTTKSRSRMHDVSHIIYGAYCEQFISKDKRLVMKARAIYSHLEIPTNVLLLDEYLIQERKQS